MSNYEAIENQVISAAASLEAFEATYLRIIEDEGCNVTRSERERAVALFYTAYDQISDAQFYLYNSRTHD